MCHAKVQLHDQLNKITFSYSLKLAKLEAIHKQPQTKLEPTINYRFTTNRKSKLFI